MHIRHLIAAAGAALAFIATTPAQAAAPLADDTFVETVGDSVVRAEAAYAVGRFDEAYQYFYWAAIRDHAFAQEMVGMMLLLGRDTFGPGVAADREGAAFWLAQAASRGRATAAHLAAALERPVSAGVATTARTTN